MAKPYLIIISVACVVILSHLLVFGFRMSNDGPYWIRVGSFLSTYGNDVKNFSPHYTFSPVIPLVAKMLETITRDKVVAFLLINMVSLILTAILLYSSTLNILKNKTVSLFASVLFLIDFQTQLLTFEVMPDIFTWLVIILLINLLQKFAAGGNISRFQVVWLGLLFGLATLVKTNLAFLALVFPIMKLCESFKKNLAVTMGYCLIFSLIPISYFSWIYMKFSVFPWSTMINDAPLIAGGFVKHFVEFFSAYLYLWPLIIAGMLMRPKVSSRLFVLLCLICTIVPIVIWPYIMARFYFTIFWCLLPLAALTTNYLFQKNKILTIVGLSLLFLLNTARVYMTLNGLTHVNFFLNIFSIL